MSLERELNALIGSLEGAGDLLTYRFRKALVKTAAELAVKEFAVLTKGLSADCQCGNISQSDVDGAVSQMIVRILSL